MYSIVIIGAGLAGLAAAHHLGQSGLDVHVYEARGRVGGRVLTAVTCGNIVELGGQNITDGGGAEHMLRLIEEFDLELVGEKVPLSWDYFTGKECVSATELLRKKKFDPAHLREQLAGIAQRSANMQEVLRELFKDDDVLYHSFCVRIAAYEGGTAENLSTVYIETLYHMLLGGLSAAHQGEGLDLLRIKGGTSLLPEKLAETLGERVHLNMPLKEVSKALDGSYTLGFPDGQKVKADILVLAIPCSVYETIAFEEGVIPKDRLEAIKDVRYGENAKILVPFPYPLASGPACVDGCIVSFFDVGRSILNLYYTGESSRFSAETISEAYLRASPLIEAGYGVSFGPQMPVLARDEAFVSYEGPVGYSWPGDPYARGSYCYIAPGQKTLLAATQEVGGESVKMLFAPIDHKLYFAGEHASILAEVPGTMEAACESGQRTARMIETTLKKLVLKRDGS
jgi:monoamine oxidase